jgi:hypothetical protein
MASCEFVGNVGRILAKDISVREKALVGVEASKNVQHSSKTMGIQADICTESRSARMAIGLVWNPGDCLRLASIIFWTIVDLF